MKISNLLKNVDNEEVEEYVELPEETGPEEEKQVKILVEKLESFVDVDRLLKKVREGNIVIAGIKELKDSNMDELKHSISKMRTVCQSFDGDIVGVGDEWLIISPSNARVVR